MIVQLRKNLYLSGSNDVNDIAKLKELGINVILNVACKESDPHYDNSILMIKIGIHEFQENTEFVINLAIKTLSHLIDNNRMVLIHCHAGAHRSPYIAFKYISEKENREINDIYKEMINKIPWNIIYPPKII